MPSFRDATAPKAAVPRPTGDARGDVPAVPGALSHQREATLYLPQLRSDDSDLSVATSTTWSAGDSFSLPHGSSTLPPSPTSSKSQDSTPTTSPSVLASPASFLQSAHDERGEGFAPSPSSLASRSRPGTAALPLDDESFSNICAPNRDDDDEDDGDGDDDMCDHSRSRSSHETCGGSAMTVIISDGADEEGAAATLKHPAPRRPTLHIPRQPAMTTTTTTSGGELQRRINDLAKGHARSLSDVVPTAHAHALGSGIASASPLSLLSMSGSSCATSTDRGQVAERALLEQALRRAEEESEKTALNVIRSMDGAGKTSSRNILSAPIAELAASNGDGPLTPIGSRMCSLSAPSMLTQGPHAGLCDLTPTLEFPTVASESASASASAVTHISTGTLGTVRSGIAEPFTTNKAVRPNSDNITRAAPRLSMSSVNSAAPDRPMQWPATVHEHKASGSDAELLLALLQSFASPDVTPSRHQGSSPAIERREAVDLTTAPALPASPEWLLWAQQMTQAVRALQQGLNWLCHGGEGSPLPETVR
ncbi:unnamed protein product [Parajaminaea phylloscopi]